MATHSSVLAWRIPGTGEPAGLPSMGSHRVRHHWRDLAAAAILWGSQVVLVVKNPLANAGDLRDVGSIPGLGRSSEEGKGNPFQHSCLENPMDRGAWRATVHGFQTAGHNLATKNKQYTNQSPQPQYQHSKQGSELESYFFFCYLKSLMLCGFGY